MYDDYMQSLLEMDYFPYESYQRKNYDPLNSSYEQFECDYCNLDMPYSSYPKNTVTRTNQRCNLEDLYPEIYNIVYPMVKKACNLNSQPLSEKLIEDLTNDIYSNLEADNIVNLSISIDDSLNTVRNSSASDKTTNNSNRTTSTSNQQSNSPVENRHSKHNKPILDLIRILLLREFSDRPPMPPQKPFPPRPGMGMPPRPGMPPYGPMPNYPYRPR